MTKKDRQHVKTGDNPLISVSHPSRYSGKETSAPIDYSVMHSGVPAQNHNKSTVMMSNLTYEYQDPLTTRLHQVIEKARTKNLNIDGDHTGVYTRFMQKEMPKHNTYYLMCDKEGEIFDSYYLHNKPLISHKTEKPFQTHTESNSLGISPPNKKVPLSHDLNNNNSRLIRSKQDLKPV